MKTKQFLKEEIIMKKLMLLGLVIAIVAVFVGINVVGNNKTLSDEELIKLYIEEDYPEIENYKIKMLDSTDDEFVSFMALDGSGEVLACAGFNRDYYTYIFTSDEY